MTSTLPTDLPVDQGGDPAARIALVLHGGGGPQTVAPIVGHLAATMHAVAPTHPGWDGTARPEAIASVADLAHAYLDHLVDRDEHDVVLIGSSIGG
nr:alpha/beta fold hydrolase [Curtobacterium sp. MCBD17_032]